jgi:hypothetical protein
VAYRRGPGSGTEGVPLGSSRRAGLAGFLAFARRPGRARGRRERLRLPLRERRPGFAVARKGRAPRAAPAAGCRAARDNDFVLKPEPLAAEVPGLERWPHSSQLTRLLRAFGGPPAAALRQAFEEPLAQPAGVRRRSRRGARAVVDVDRPDRPANGRTDAATARGPSRKKGPRG